jgi:hypothetical protein
VRLIVVFAAVMLAAGVAVSVASAFRFADQPCTPTTGDLRVCPSGTVGSLYDLQLKGEAGCGPALPYQYKVLNGGLPQGLSLSSSGRITGTPQGAGTANFWIELSDEDPPSQSWCVPKKAEREFTITINPGFRIDNAVTSKYWTLNQSKSEQLTATVLTNLSSGQPATNAVWSVISGALPAGVTLSTTGLLSGTPTAEGISTFKVHAVNGGVSDDETFTIDVKRAVTVAGPATSPKSEVGVAYELKLSVSGGAGGTYTWAAIDGTLPTGVSFDTADGSISGTPSAAGVYTFTATATDSQGRAGTYAGRIVVAAKLVVTKPVAKPARQGKLYRLKLRTTGGVVPLKWKVTKGPLPKGVKLDKATGVISGKPTKAGRYKITVEVTDSLKVKSTQSFTIVVQPAPAN